MKVWRVVGVSEGCVDGVDAEVAVIATAARRAGWEFAR